MISILAKRRDAHLTLSRPSCQNKDRIASWALQVGIRACTDLGAPLIDRTLVESSLVKNCFESSYISESRILFTPLLCSGEESWHRNFNSTIFSLNFFRIMRVFWNLYDVDVTETLSLVPPVRMDWTRGVELQGVLDTSLSFSFLSISGRGCLKLLQYYSWCEECGGTQYWGAGSHVLPSLVSLWLRGSEVDEFPRPLVVCWGMWYTGE